MRPRGSVQVREARAESADVFLGPSRLVARGAEENGRAELLRAVAKGQGRTAPPLLRLAGLTAPLQLEPGLAHARAF